MRFFTHAYRKIALQLHLVRIDWSVHRLSLAVVSKMTYVSSTEDRKGDVNTRNGETEKEETMK